LGALARYYMGQWIGQRTTASLPLGTMAINLSGSFLIGFFTSLTNHVAPALIVFLIDGFTGAFTTFSTFMYETIKLIEDRLPLEALITPLLSIALGLFMVIIGIRFGQEVI
ncbi:MAG: fluoride efflux transporter CrcB, partial [Firmicutes bacterium]|nr:fluoride efflux transporter CrcB [Bacillota bacterium]